MADSTTRTVPLVDFSEFDEVLSNLKTETHSSETQVMIAAGYSSSAAAEWRNNGKAPRRALLALIGLSTQLNIEAKLKSQPVQRQFTYYELSRMFAVMHGIVVPESQYRDLSTKIAAEMAKVDES